MSNVTLFPSPTLTATVTETGVESQPLVSHPLMVESSAPLAATPAQVEGPMTLDSVYDMVIGGGPVMIPIALCSIVALTYTVERSIRLAPAKVGSRRFGRRILDSVQAADIKGALEICESGKNALARVFAEGLRHADNEPRMEKAMEDAGAREVKRLGANLRPLVVVAVISPLLGLLGTVWGLIQAFSKLATAGELGKAELLAAGISQALVTTAAGLVIAIPAQAIYYYFRGKIDRFARHTEDLYVEVAGALRDQSGSVGVSPAAVAPASSEEGSDAHS